MVSRIKSSLFEIDNCIISPCSVLYLFFIPYDLKSLWEVLVVINNYKSIIEVKFR